MRSYGALESKIDVDQLYDVGRGKGGRCLISCEKCIKSEDNNLVWYI